MSWGSARGRLSIALLLSTLVHLLAGGGLTWPTTQTPELPGPPIAAVLNPAPASSSTQTKSAPRLAERPPAARRSPGPVPRDTPAAHPAAEDASQPATPASPAQSAVTAQADKAAEAATVPAANEDEPAPAPPTPPAERPVVPSAFTIRYVVKGSEGGFTLGRLQHTWQSDGQRYSLSAVAQASGILRLIYSRLLTQTSLGEITAEGLRPDHYWLQRGQRQLQAHFDWVQMQADLGPDRPPQALEPGTQDLLSVMYQVSLFPPPAEGRIWVLDGKRLREYGYWELARETLELPIGQVATRHLKVAAEGSEESFELWLREVHPQLPVKIRMLGNRQGDAVLLAESIEGLDAVADSPAD
ncbi:MAG: DUF3108 domain-containing protein [Thiobacillaceae bacterium]